MSKEEQTKVIDDFNEDEEIVNDSNLWDYKEEGSTIMGYVIEINEEGTYGRDIVVDNGTEQKTLPSLTALKSKLVGIEIGDKVKVTCLGMLRSANKKDYYDFQVFIRKPEKPD